MPLDVTVELARIPTTVGQVLALRPGSTLLFQPHHPTQVDLVIGNAPVAFGEPVAVDDELGVRITELVFQSSSEHSV